MIFVLLTGAGFSRNWGGWLASEAMEYLLGSRLGTGHKQLLWKNRHGGFENALAELQNRYALNPNIIIKNEVDVFQSAIINMFNAMDTGFAHSNFEPISDAHFRVRNFLARFDAIFTLNQDLLLEQHYLNENITLASTRKWRGWQIPGLKLLHPISTPLNPAAKTALKIPDLTAFDEKRDFQPYYKLHGSSNWRSDTGETMLIMGGGKDKSISRNPLLNWYSTKFAEYISRPRVRLMIVGYSFGDSHINQTILGAAERGGLELFVIDPRGIDVLDQQLPHASMRAQGELMSKLSKLIIGASRRPLNSTFSGDRVEFEKLARFFER